MVIKRAYVPSTCAPLRLPGSVRQGSTLPKSSTTSLSLIVPPLIRDGIFSTALQLRTRVAAGPDPPRPGRSDDSREGEAEAIPTRNVAGPLWGSGGSSCWGERRLHVAAALTHTEPVNGTFSVPITHFPEVHLYLPQYTVLPALRSLHFVLIVVTTQKGFLLCF